LAREVEVNGECLPHHKSHMIWPDIESHAAWAMARLQVLDL
jgi:hypothetical protein